MCPKELDGAQDLRSGLLLRHVQDSAGANGNEPCAELMVKLLNCPLARTVARRDLLHA